jgi:predicted nucleotide-binding protein (sugar kinase/HSP70/actin superfamily)
MLQAGRVIHEAGSRARCVPTSYTKDEIHEVMCDVGKAFVVKKIDWDSTTGEAVVHLEPSNGVEWEFHLVRS